MKTFLLFCLTLSLAFVCQGQARSTKTSNNVPPSTVANPAPPPLKPAPSRTVFNFTLGEPLKGIDRRCERENRVGYTDFYLYLCTLLDDTVNADGFYTDGIITINYPKGGILLRLDEPHIKAAIINGRLEELRWYTNGLGAQREMMLTLEDKFGKPSSERWFEVTTNSGRNHNKIVAEWKFSDLEITYHSLFTSVNKGFVLITTPAGKAHQQKEAEKPETPTVKM